jgi:hypothetical protein
VLLRHAADQSQKIEFRHVKAHTKGTDAHSIGNRLADKYAKPDGGSMWMKSTDFAWIVYKADGVMKAAFGTAAMEAVLGQVFPAALRALPVVEAGPGALFWN